MSDTILFNERHSALLHVSIPKESSSGNSYKIFQLEHVCDFTATSMLCVLYVNTQNTDVFKY